jgi:alpha-methylacyl-CoA racemase
MAGPLNGLRVIELSGTGPGPSAAMMLSDMGAEVVEVSRPSEMYKRPYPVTGRGRRKVVLDLKKPGGTEAFLDLVARADVLIEPYRLGVAERLGIGPNPCRERNPRLIYARMTGWGQDGPWAQAAGHDIAYIAVTGALNAIGRAGGPPVPPLNLLGDFGGGTMFLLVGIVAALYERERSGEGQVIDASIVDRTAALTSFIHDLIATGSWTDERGVNMLDTGRPFYDVYETADGGWMAVGAIEPHFYAELVRLLELEDLPPQLDRSRWSELRARLAARFKDRTREEWTVTFAGSDACVAPVLSDRGRDARAQHRPRHHRRAGRHHPAGAGAALLPDTIPARRSAAYAGPGHALRAVGLGRRRRRRAHRLRGGDPGRLGWWTSGRC